MKRILVIFCVCITFSLKAQEPDFYFSPDSKNAVKSRLVEIPYKIERSSKEQSSRKYGPFRIILDPKEKTILSSELNAIVTKIHKRMGDSFEPNDILISLDRKVVEGSYGKAAAKRDKALLEWEGKKQLFDKDLISLFEVKEAEAAYAEALSDSITALKYLTATEIRANSKGRVVRLAIEENELAQAGKELIEIVRDDSILVHFLAPGYLLSCLKLGSELILSIDGKEQKAAISRLSPIIDPASGTIKVEAELNNEKRVWTPGQVGKAWMLCK